MTKAGLQVDRLESAASEMVIGQTALSKMQHRGGEGGVLGMLTAETTESGLS